MTIEEQSAPARTGSREAADFRPDIQALRAIAVGLVVVYHLWPHRLTGGYIGVDVFFVISGFLITSHLWREAAATGRIRLGRFWARRARRLLPSALLVLLATAVASWLLAPVTEVRGFLAEVAAATLYAENWFLAIAAVDYQAIGHAASPVQHYWSLSVEEQFYVLLPVLLVAALWAAARLSLPRRGVVVGVVAVVGAGSFAYSWWLTAWSAGAYFSTFTRLWEFVLGAAVAVALQRSRSHGGAVLAGLALMLGAAVVMNDATPFPGWQAAIPVVGTALVLAWGDRTLLSRVGAWRPVAHVGRTSYAIYLWHWPLIVLVPFALGRELGLVEKLGIGIATLLLAAASTSLVEDPVRFSPRLLGGRAPWVVAAWSAAGMAVVLGAVVAGTVATEHRAERERELAASLEAQLGDCVGAAAEDAAEGCADPEPAADGGEVETEPAHFIPPLADLEDDDENRDECWTGLTGRRLDVCALGETDAPTKRFLVLGDSHANALIPAFDQAGSDRGWAFDLAGHAACPFTTEPAHTADAQVREACDAWRADVRDLAATADAYDGVIVTQQVRILDEAELERSADGLVDAWSVVPAGVPILAVRDNPRLPDEFVACLEQEGPAGADACGWPQDSALRVDPQGIAAMRDDRASLIDMSDVYCADGTCDAVIGSVVAYRPDGHHLTATFARTLAPRLADEIEAALGS
ncbi:acyltransferase family protein [Demequina sp. SYSU T00039]|uniref:Acyltransferase family protein n=1 Tax=Demequina lignilytica TaxID=3051663 RepID=A0AAW7M438_9MICO|nr:MULTISPECIES: acyltransferase family protein [unclassified Demequina]MDN4478093.1 acyltransferase family protein [Demequina sp. SYSU T00039-1]MDN4488457.1 acyltransferase family protein [Demequina sp. SYSU T00039]MDN4489996.1 acyltransferase family protein [Demequina sp. SYSU T00068]